MKFNLRQLQTHNAPYHERSYMYSNRIVKCFIKVQCYPNTSLMDCNKLEFMDHLDNNIERIMHESFGA